MQPVNKDLREKERNACLSNNIGVGNTFVWASRYSNLNNYSGMVEDTTEPENNTCFVKVELSSDDSRIDVLKDFFKNKDYKVNFAEFENDDVIRLDFTENGVDKTLRLNLDSGESNVFDVL